MSEEHFMEDDRDLFWLVIVCMLVMIGGSCVVFWLMHAILGVMALTMFPTIGAIVAATKKPDSVFGFVFILLVWPMFLVEWVLDRPSAVG